jgi:AraC-like DNA-binding protein
MPTPAGDGERKSVISVWDTQYIPPTKAFRFYRDALCSVYMPWATTCEYAADFHGRFETAAVSGGTVSRNQCSPMICIRSREEVARSDDECFYVLYVLSGFHGCEQRDRSNVARPGEIIVVDSGQPCRVVNGAPPYSVLCLTVPKAKLRAIANPEDHLANVVLKRGLTTNPLLSCAALLTQRLTTSSEAELATLYDAFVSLLPLAAGCFDNETRHGLDARQNSELRRSIEDFVDDNLADPELSARKAAERLGISARYVHKIFSETGLTFSAYVGAARLDRIRDDLFSPAWGKRPIADLAFRWGFNDISTFNRAFKRRFGCAPTQYRR